MRPLLLAALLALPASATHPVKRPAPDLPPDHVWLYGQGLALKALRNRRAVIVAFLNTANINSLRAMDVLQKWHERYGLEGLMVLGVHTPTFLLQRDPAAVRSILRRRKADFPVLLDNEKAAYKSWEVEGWPSLFLLDRKGRVVYESLGEGRYSEFEGEIRSAIGDLPDYREPTGPLAAADPPTRDCGEATPEFALTPDRAVLDANAAPPGDRAVVGAGQVFTSGRWSREPDGMHMVQENKDRDALLRVVYRGAQAFALLSPGAEATKVYVKQNELWLHPLNIGADVSREADGRSYVAVSEPRLYHLAKNPNDALQELTLIPSARDAGVHAFSFTDRCLPLP